MSSGITPEKVAVDSLDKLHGATNLVAFTAYSWNIFRYVGDYLHLAGVVILLAVIAKNKSVAGLSRSTQILYFMVFITRYLDLLDHSQNLYLVFFKLTYISASIVTLVLFNQYDGTYERRNDTVNLPIIILPCATAAVLLTNDYSMLEVLWTFSEFIEAFAMVPQYVFCYRDRRGGDWGTTLYVTCIGTYRVFYALNWIYKKYEMPNYSDVQSWIGGVIEIAFFLDFLNYRFTGNSMLRSMALTIDTKINEISDKVELKVLGTSSQTRCISSDGEGGEVRRRRRADDGEAAVV